jgi:beta-glucosidase
LTEQLRDEFGFDGYVSSDFGAISGLGEGNHAVAATDADCVRMFIEAGGSVNGHDFGDNYEKLVVGLVEGGNMPEATLDKATANVLRVKARLGLIVGGPNATNATLYTDESLIRTSLGANAEHVAVGLRAARESVVLIKNEQSTLPLVGARKVLVLGPNADEARMGDYSAAGWAGAAPNGGGNIDNKNIVPVLEGIKVRVHK